MKNIKMVKVNKPGLKIPQKEILAKMEILNLFIDFVIRRIYLRRGQFLRCNAKFELHNQEYVLFANFSKVAGSVIEPGKVIKTTVQYQGANGVMIMKDNISQNIEIDGWSFSEEMSFKELAQYVIDELK